jgi:uncharacterized protein YidB (DUF937 family)
MDLMGTAASLLGEKLGINAETAIAGLQKLFGNSAGQLDIASLVGLMQQGGLNDIVSSWLGDGGNQAISPDALQNAIGADKIGEAASTMGVDSGSLLGGLSDMVPQLVDQASSGGSLLDSVGGLGGVADIAKKLF